MFVIELRTIKITPDRTYSRYYAGKGKYCNSFSVSTSIRGAMIFGSKEEAEKRVASDDFQYRLKSENETLEAIGHEPYNPQIRKICLQ